MREVSVVSVAEPPRRERKKRQTRDALVHAALKLFDAKGYEHTAVREITDAVDVSERTFFRYFASKDDVVRAFRKLAMEHHPDRHAADGPEAQEAATRKFVVILEAYERLRAEAG